MCYSEKLEREAGGHLVHGEWILQGWKGVMAVQQVHTTYRRHVRPKWKDPLYWNNAPATLDRTEVEEYITHETQPTGLTEYRAFYQPDFIYTLGEPMTDEHGIHLAATQAGAEKATANLVYSMRSWRSYYVCDWKLAILPILVRESSIRDNHAHEYAIVEDLSKVTPELLEQMVKKEPYKPYDAAVEQAFRIYGQMQVPSQYLSSNFWKSGSSSAPGPGVLPSSAPCIRIVDELTNAPDLKKLAVAYLDAFPAVLPLAEPAKTKEAEVQK